MLPSQQHTYFAEVQTRAPKSRRTSQCGAPNNAAHAQNYAGQLFERHSFMEQQKAAR